MNNKLWIHVKVTVSTEQWSYQGSRGEAETTLCVPENAIEAIKTGNIFDLLLPVAYGEMAAVRVANDTDDED